MTSHCRKGYYQPPLELNRLLTSLVNCGPATVEFRSWYPQLRTPVREYSVGRTAMCRHLVLRDPSGSLGQILLLKTVRRRNQGIASCKPLFGERLNLKGGGGTAIDLSGEKLEILLDPSQKFTQI